MLLLIYALINIRKQFSNFNTRYVITPNGTTYALIVTDVNAMNLFLQNYPPLNTPSFAPTFPTALNDEYNDIFTYYSGTQEMALAYMLDKYNTGIALTKMDGNNNFKKLETKETNIGGSMKSYTTNNCP